MGLDILKTVATRFATAIIDAVKHISDNSVTLFAVLLSAFFLSFVPTWFLGVAVLILGAAIVGFTYRDELKRTEELKRRTDKQ